MRKKLLLLFTAFLMLAAGSAWFLSRTSKPHPLVTIPDSSVKTNQANNQPMPSFDKTKHPTDKADSIWVIASKVSELNPLQYAPTDLVAIGNGQQLRKEAASAWIEMTTAAKASGFNLQPLSGYRSYATQVSVYNKEVATYGQATTDKQSAKPGRSEHQTGLALDVGGGGCGIEDCFGNTAEGKWLAANAHSYGFIIRYVPGKESITGYRAEPWHIRYVGKELSLEMKRTAISTLEEFFNLVPEKQPY